MSVDARPDTNSGGAPAALRRSEGGPGRVTRRTWAQLTSMRTALILLFLLALASVPGSLFPQRERISQNGEICTLATGWNTPCFR